MTRIDRSVVCSTRSPRCQSRCSQRVVRRITARTSFRPVRPALPRSFAKCRAGEWLVFEHRIARQGGCCGSRTPSRGRSDQVHGGANDSAMCSSTSSKRSPDSAEPGSPTLPVGNRVHFPQRLPRTTQVCARPATFASPFSLLRDQASDRVPVARTRREFVTLITPSRSSGIR